MQCKESDFSKAPQNVEASEDCIGYCEDGMWTGSETREERVRPGNELEQLADSSGRIPFVHKLCDQSCAEKWMKM